MRPALPDELARLPALELASDSLLAGWVDGPLPGPATAAELAASAAVLVAGDARVGFARLEVVDGDAHLEQLSVHPAHARQGWGGRLLEASCRWAAGAGHRRITLCTFADVPFNAPLYRRAGFVELPPPWGPGLTAARRREQAAGLDALGRRLVMVRRLGEASGAAPR